MGTAQCLPCLAGDDEDDERKALLNNETKTNAQTESLESICTKLEEMIQDDIGKRGIANLHIPGELFNAVHPLINAKHVVIATGFPCCEKETHTESDGPAGIMLLAFALLNDDSERKVTIVTDPVNKAPMEGLIEYFNKRAILKAKKDLSLFVVSDDINFEDDFIKSDQFKDVDVMVACELAANTKDGTFRTMSAIDISDKCGKTAALFDYVHTKGKDIVTIGIGDGGNECGMGKVEEKVRKHIKNGEQIASVISCDYLITAGVSNWAAEALGVAIGPETHCDSAFHRDVYLKMGELGIVDGVNGDTEGSVDGFEYSVHAKMYDALCAVVADVSLP